jgi:hypothetical protein
LSDLKHQVDAIGLIHEKLIIPYSALIITFVRTSISLSSTLRLP